MVESPGGEKISFRNLISFENVFTHFTQGSLDVLELFSDETQIKPFHLHSVYHHHNSIRILKWGVGGQHRADGVF